MRRVARLRRNAGNLMVRVAHLRENTGVGRRADHNDHRPATLARKRAASAESPVLSQPVGMRNRVMNRLLLSIGCVVCLLQAARVSAADDEWQGQMIMLKETAAPQIGTRRVNADDVPQPAVVQQVQGDWLWLGIAWVKKGDAVLLDDAPAYFTKQIESGRNVASGYMLRAISWLGLKHPRRTQQGRRADR